MFIFKRQLWGPVAGLATALLLVLVLGMGSDIPSARQTRAPAQLASVR
jgi:hypothetical protein